MDFKAKQTNFALLVQIFVFNSWDLTIFMLFSNVHNYKKRGQWVTNSKLLVLLTWNCFHFIFYPLILAITETLSYDSCPNKEQRTSSSLVLNLPYQTLRKTSIHIDFIIRIISEYGVNNGWHDLFKVLLRRHLQNIYNRMLMYSIYMNKPGKVQTR